MIWLITFKKHKASIFITSAIILVIVSNIFFVKLALDFVFIFLALISLLFKKQKEFIKDWLPPTILFFLYEYVRGRAYIIATFLHRPLIIQQLIDVEHKLFSITDKIPTVYLQYTLSNPLAPSFTAHWYDYILFVFYTSFFWFWVFTGYLVWRKNRSTFRQYMYGLAGFSLVDAVFYSLFPTAPPWYASEIGLLPHLNRVMFSYDYIPTQSLSVVNTYGNNLFAAFPSHHAAWPFFAAIFLVYVFGKKALPVFIIPMVIAFATWYGAEHYVIDSLAGFSTATITFLLVTGKGALYFRKIKERLTGSSELGVNLK